MSMYPTASYADFKGPGLMDRFRAVLHPMRWFRRRLLRKPGSTLAMSCAALLSGGIVVNAVALQTERHPAPMFTSLIDAPLHAEVEMPLPPVRPHGVDRKADPVATAAVAPVQKAPRTPPATRDAEQPAARIATAKDQMLAIIKQSTPEPVVESQNRTVLVQKALNRAGYGPLKEDGAFGPGTKQALEKFEADRKLPVRGEATGRTARELTRASGVSFE